MTTPVCEHCGSLVDAHDRDIRFLEPEQVLRAGGLAQTEVWMTGPSPDESEHMKVEGVGAFVRAILTVHLTGGYSVSYGLWVEVDPAHLDRALDVWWDPEYAHLQMEGAIANIVEPWGLLGSRVVLRVREESELPYCVESPDELLNAVISNEWDHRVVLDTLPE